MKHFDSLKGTPGVEFDLNGVPFVSPLVEPETARLARAAITRAWVAAGVSRQLVEAAEEGVQLLTDRLPDGYYLLKGITIPTAKVLLRKWHCRFDGPQWQQWAVELFGKPLDDPENDVVPQRCLLVVGTVEKPFLYLCNLLRRC